MRIASAIFALLMLLPSLAEAQSNKAIPPALVDWVPWVLEGHEHQACPFMLGQTPGGEEEHLCAWPGLLEIDVSADSARFGLSWTVLKDSWLRLPGDSRLRPQDVTVDGRSAVVLMNGGNPMLRLQAGRQRVEGRLTWTKRPTTLPVPESIAMVSLRLDGSLIPVPERDGDQLWLGRVATEVGADTLDFRVFRRLDDGLPMRLTTQINLEVSGRAREVSLDQALPEGFAPVAIQSQLPVAMLADGGLRVQLRPGTWPVTIEARALQVQEQAGPPAASPPWPTEEIWSWRAAPELRVVEVEGGTPVDPAQVGAPWGEPLPTMVLDRNQKLSVVERSRGKDAEQAHRLNLRRELWLAFDGASVVSRDQLSGRLAAVGRLNVTAPWTLQRASETGGDLLVTEDESGQAGVELRNPQLNMQSTGRHEGRGSMPASGWAVDVETMSAVLNLPPGWRLFAARGVDQAPQTWVGQWSLLDMFLLAVAGLLAFRLHGVGFAVLVLAYLALGYHEEDSPLWSVLGVIALALLLGVLSAGRLAKVLRAARAVLLGLAFVLALPFVAQQLKLALHPQLERSAVERNSDYGDAYLDAVTVAGTRLDSSRAESQDYAEIAADAATAQEATPMAMAPPAPPPSPMPQSKANMVQRQQLNAYPDDAVLQAGPGTPDWRWQRIQLGWSGPVLASQSMDLWLSPPGLTRLLRVLAVALLIALLLRLTHAATPLPRAWLRGRATPAVALLVLSLTFASPPADAADYPSTELLDELRERVLEAPKCAPQCASLDVVEVELVGDELRVALVLHAEADVAVPLPDPGKSAAPLRAELGGSEVPITRQRGQSWLSLPRGVQRAQLTWRIAAVDQLDLRFPMIPGAVAVRAAGWESGSLDGSRLLGDTLQLLRLRVSESDSDAQATAAVAQEFPPFVRVTRRLLLDLDWTVSTVVERIAPAQSGFSVTLPLIAGERVLDDSLEVTDGAVKLSFAAGEQAQSWQSRLPITEKLALTMGPLSRASERWEVQLGAYWHAEFAGLPESSIDAEDGVWRFDPRPDEVLQLDLSRPKAVAGSSLALDQVTLEINQGSRARDSTLSVDLRSTRGGQHAFSIPADAELISASVGGASRSLRVENGQVRVPIVPGAQAVVLSWRRPLESEIWQRGDPVDLGAPSANLRTNLTISGERWLLAAGGAGVGPAVLYWGQLVVMLLIAVGLAKLSTSTPLRFHHWLLLGLGFSTVSWLAAGAVVAWLLLLDWRQRKAACIVGHVAFPLVQLLLVLVSLLALVVLLAAIPYGLLGSPDMQVVGNGSSAGRLLWFSDESTGPMPAIWAISLPLWTYKLAILLWSLWLANALIGWLRWGWSCLSSGGYWPPPKPKPAPAAQVAPASEGEAAVASEPPPLA